jgi:hypothetical protein
MSRPEDQKYLDQGGIARPLPTPVQGILFDEVNSGDSLVVVTPGAESNGSTVTVKSPDEAELFDWSVIDVAGDYSDGLALWDKGEGGVLVRSDGGQATLRTMTGSARIGAASGAVGVYVQDQATGKLSFFNATPVVKPTGVTVDAAAIHAALVSLGLIST